MLTLTFHGHACFTLEADARRVIIDPFLTGNPATDIPLGRLPKIDAVLLSHGHGDHLGDALPIAQRDGATIVATAELARFCGERGATVPVPIGNNYAIGIEDAARAVEFVQPRTVIPMHYNTWDLITADPEQFKRQVGGRARVVVLAPGDAHTLS